MEMKMVVGAAAVVAAGTVCGAADGVVPVRFRLDAPAHVTLTVEDPATKNRVRNLIADQYFAAGEHVVWWDGMDDHSQANVRQHGGYDAAGRTVNPGKYQVRGIAHDPINLKWQFCPYMPNNPVRTSDRKGQWLSDHTPPSAACYAGGTNACMLFGATLAEGAHGFMWTDLEGRKIEGATHIGDTYTGAAKICTPKGAGTLEGYGAWALGVNEKGYVIAGIDNAKRKVCTVASVRGEFFPKTGKYDLEHRTAAGEHSLAVYGKTAAVSLPYKDKIVFVDLGNGTHGSGKVTGKEIAVKNPKGIASDDAGNLYVLSGDRLVKIPDAFGTGGKVETIAEGLDDPRELVLAEDRYYVSCRGESHQVWALDAKGGMFSRIGKVKDKIGKAGKPKCGAYDERKMQNPNGLTLDAKGRLWVAEEDYHPKRISVWEAKSGKFIKALYGAVQYGGGGKIDPVDPKRFYYDGMEFELDWEKGESKLKRVFMRRDREGKWFEGKRVDEAKGNWMIPCDPVHIGGRQYMCNTYNARPVNGPEVEAVYLLDEDAEANGGEAKLVAMFGQTGCADWLLDTSLSNLLTKAQHIGAKHYNYWAQKPWGGENSLFAWSDLNGDGQVQREEVTICAGKAIGINRCAGTLDLISADGTLARVQRFTEAGVPVYDLTKAERPFIGWSEPNSQMVLSEDRKGYALLAYAPEVKAANGVGKWAGGAVTGRTGEGYTWFYPYAFRGLHASQLFPYRNPLPGELVGGTKLIGEPIKLGNDGIEVFALNANSGQIYLMTVDGMFVAALFRHGWFAEPWGTTVLKRGDSVNTRSSDGEGFEQTITRTPDGKVYLQALNHTSSIVSVEGLDTIRRLPTVEIEVTKEMIEKAKAMETAAEAARQAKAGRKTLDVACSAGPMAADGDDADWGDAEFAPIDVNTEAALKVARNAEGKPALFAVWRTTEQNLLANSGAEPRINMFKTGGAADLQIATTEDFGKSAKRLLMAKVDGKLRALLYEPKSEKQGGKGEVSSPHRTITFDWVGDVSDKIKYGWKRHGGRHYRVTSASTLEELTTSRRFQWAPGMKKVHEFEIPLETLGLKVRRGMKVRGDLGMLGGDGNTVMRRIYWHNKGTAHLYDAPEEAMLHPELWGDFRFKAVETPKEGRNVHVLKTKFGGEWAIDSGKVGKEACCGIGWSGEGELAQRLVGKNGYVAIRFDPDGWFKRDTRIKTSAAVKVEEKDFHREGRYQDGLLQSTHINRTRPLSIDGTFRKGRHGSGGGFSSLKEILKAEWRMGFTDGKRHRVTCVLGAGGKGVRLGIVQEGKDETLCELGAEDAEKTVVVQFDAAGEFVLKFEQKSRTPEDGVGIIEAIFFD